MKPRKPLLRSTKPIPRGKAPKRSQKRIKQTNAYHRPEWRKKVRGIRKRSGGICEAQIRCGGNPVQGDPHHLSYNEEFVGWQRLMVDDDQLVDCFHDCHVEYERRKDA